MIGKVSVGVIFLHHKSKKLPRGPRGPGEAGRLPVASHSLLFVEPSVCGAKQPPGKQPPWPPGGVGSVGCVSHRLGSSVCLPFPHVDSSPDLLNLVTLPARPRGGDRAWLALLC